MKSFQLILCLFLVAAASSAQIVPMTNDECTTPLTVIDGINPAPALSGYSYTNVGSTTSVGTPAVCASYGADTWFQYVATTTGAVTFAMCTPTGFAAGTLADSVIQVLDGACPPTQVLACDDDGGCLNAAGSPGAVTICVTLGTTYTIRCAGWAGAIGTFYLSVTAVGPAAVPNDDCSTAIALAVGPNGPFTNGGATDSCSAASCGTSGSQGYHDIWFSYYAPCGGVVTVDTGCAAGAFDTVMTVYGSCGGAELACNDDCPSGSLGSSITFVAATGGLYPIRVASWSAAITGSFTVTVTQNPGLGLLYTSPFGPGSLQIDVVGGPPAGIYFLAVTFYQGAFPLGWFFGIDATVAELSGLVNAGFPFVGPLDATCGGFAIGPIGGIGFLSGIPIYSVAVGIPPGLGVVPTGVSAPTTYTIP